MNFQDAESIRQMIDGHWNLRMNDATADLWMQTLLPEDATEATAVVARMAKTMHYPPKISDFTEVLAAMHPPKEAEVDCTTCQGDRFIVYALRRPVTTIWMSERGLAANEEEMIEEMAPCPDCNSDCDTEFSRGGGGRARALDPALVRERMNR